MSMRSPRIRHPTSYYHRLMGNKQRYFAFAMVITGIILLTMSAGYYVYSGLARANLHELDYDISLEPTDQLQILAKAIPSVKWESPRWAKVSDFPNRLAINEYDPTDKTRLGSETGAAPYPIRLLIPAISLSSPIKELKIVNLGDDRDWETPKDVVGHIPSTVRPGENGNVYLFGHLHSPIKGEGSVFRRLPAIPDLLKKGEDIYIEITNKEYQDFLYRVTETKVVHRDDFSLDTTNSPMLTLVACVPKYVYDHRLLVIAEFIGTK